MAAANVTQAFNSGLQVEESFIELKCLVQSYLDLAGEDENPMLFTLDKAISRYEVSLNDHQAILHSLVNS